ncbi:hypothetical protein ACKAV7_014921 [Fusarium commune]|uniref:SH3 domain-containing protein n=1 Tax=Fusarium oxysporum f. sp. rapae TaxID=485398 RepID=A0A8J5NJ08_FUSOX|nr:hypothetical protein Forpe1208_v013819 [Fusarium oxysporum f. sp. rapae]KAI7763671.1 hypothetical protein LZL87_011528 [Fusarium oxysporum]
MEQDWEEVKHRAMRGRLHSLRIRLMDLANNLANLTTEQLDIHCGAIIEDLRSFSYDCMVESRDRLDEAQFQWRVGKIGELMDFCVDEELKNIEQNEHHKHRMTREKRRAMLMDLRIDIPLTESCFVPYDAYDFFMNLGKNLKDLVFDELRHRAYDHAMASLQSVKQEQGVSERPLPQRHLHEESTTDNVLEQESRELAIRDNVYRCRWAANQIDAYQRYLQLPVTDNVASAAVEEYDDCVELQSPCPPGMSLLVLTRAGDWWFAQPVNPSAKKPRSRGPMPNLEVITITRDQLRSDHEFVGDAFKKEVLEVQPSLKKLDIDFEKAIGSQFGIVVAWKFVGGDVWMDRYGHIVPKKVIDESTIHTGQTWSSIRE